MDWAIPGVGIALAQLGVGIPPLFAARRYLHDERSDQRGEPRSEARELRSEARAAYFGFLASATRLHNHLTLLGEIGMPPSPLGALWTWPQVRRSQLTLIDAADAMSITVGQIVVLGSGPVRSAAFDVATSLVETAQSFPRSNWRWQVQPHAKGVFQAALEASRPLLRDYVMAIEAEVGDDLADHNPESHN